MKKSLFLAICLATALYVVIASNMWGSPTFINLPFEAMRLLYIPSVLVASICAVISIWQIICSKQKVFFTVCLFICLPMIAYYSYRPEYFYMKGYKGDQKMTTEFHGQSRNSLLFYVMAYYELHPDRFHLTGEADVVKIDGLTDYIHGLSPPLTWANCPPGWTDTSDLIKIKGDQILSPWGTPILFLLDTNGDGFIKSPSGKLTVNEYADPWQRPHFKYKVAQ